MSNPQDCKSFKTINMNELFKMKDKIPAKYDVSFRSPIEVNENTMLSDVFFSKKNTSTLQNGIRSGVFKKSNSQYLIKEQDYDELQIIMRSIFLQKHNYILNISNVKDQVKILNQLVLKYSINQVFNAAQGHLKYLQDSTTLVVPLALPIMSKNDNTELEFKKWI